MGTRYTKGDLVELRTTGRLCDVVAVRQPHTDSPNYVIRERAGAPHDRKLMTVKASDIRKP